MSESISSNNQSGGITAKTVVIEGAQVTISATNTHVSQSNTTASPRNKRRTWSIVAAIGLVASVLGIFQFFGYSGEAVKSNSQQQLPSPPKTKDTIVEKGISPSAKTSVEKLAIEKSKPSDSKQGRTVDKKSMKDGVTNITSYNQSGGITAHTVNIGSQPRKLTPQFEKD